MNKVILIGASSTLLKDKLGETIDSFDIVCRINSGGRPECLTGEYKDIIGSKTNIWLCKHIALLRMYQKNHTYDDLVEFGDKEYTWYFRVTKGSYILKKCKKALKEFNNNLTRPTAGILSIFYLLDIYGSISICGFDGFKGGHWYGNKFLDQQDLSDIAAAKGSGSHDAIKETEYIDYLVKNNKINRIDEQRIKR